MDFGNNPALRSVFIRTPAGQREAIGNELVLCNEQRRILLLVNGFTPLSHFAVRLEGLPDLEWHVRELLDAGLIEEVGVTRNRRTNTCAAPSDSAGVNVASKGRASS